MERSILSLLLMLCLTTKAQTMLNEKGVYEVIKVEQYEDLNAEVLYDRTLVALSDIKGSSSHSKFNIDVAEKTGGIIVYKGELFIGYHKVNISGGYNYFADLTLKVRCKDGRVQYTITVPTMTPYWDGNLNINDNIPLTVIMPDYKYKGKLSLVKKGLLQYAPEIANCVSVFLDDIIKHTKNFADDF